MKRILVSSLAVASLLLGVGKVSASGFIIDNFHNVSVNDINSVDATGTDQDGTFWSVELCSQDGAPGCFDQNGNPRTSTTVEEGCTDTNGQPCLTGTIGGYRRTSASYAGDNIGLTNLQISAPYPTDPPTNESLQTPGSFIASSSDTSNTSVEITWDRGLSDVDFLANFDKFYVNVIRSDLNGDIRITVNKGTKYVSLQRDVAIGTMSFYFGDFTGTGDISTLSNPDSIVLTLVPGTNALDIEFELFGATTPEPSLILGSVIALGLGIVSVKRKQEQD